MKRPFHGLSVRTGKHRWRVCVTLLSRAKFHNWSDWNVLCLQYRDFPQGERDPCWRTWTWTQTGFRFKDGSKPLHNLATKKRFLKEILKKINKKDSSNPPDMCCLGNKTVKRRGRWRRDGCSPEVDTWTFTGVYLQDAEERGCLGRKQVND